MTSLFTTVRGDRAVDHLVGDGWLTIDIDHDDPPGTFWPLAPSPATVATVREARRGIGQGDAQSIKTLIRSRYTDDLRLAFRQHRVAFDAITGVPGAVIIDGEHDATYRETLVSVLGRLGHPYISSLMHGTGYADSVVIWLDLETGGVTPKHALLEIAAFATAGLNGPILGRYHVLVKPNGVIDDEARVLNGYSEQAWLHAQSEMVAIGGFSKWVRSFSPNALHVAGYNVPFDLRMLGLAAERVRDGWLFELLRKAETSDVYQLHKASVDAENRKLVTVCAWAGIDFWGPPHGAEPDICATRRFHLKMAGVRT